MFSVERLFVSTILRVDTPLSDAWPKLFYLKVNSGLPISGGHHGAAKRRSGSQQQMTHLGGAERFLPAQGPMLLETQFLGEGCHA
jgi:hypothetical protein